MGLTDASDATTWNSAKNIHLYSLIKELDVWPNNSKIIYVLGENTSDLKQNKNYRHCNFLIVLLFPSWSYLIYSKSFAD